MKYFYDLKYNIDVISSINYMFYFHGYLDNIQSLKNKVDNKQLSFCKYSNKSTKFKNSYYGLLKNENVDIVFCDILKCENNIVDFDTSINKEEGKGYLGLITLLMKRNVLDEVGLYSDYYPHSMDQEFIDRYYYKKFNKDWNNKKINIII